MVCTTRFRRGIKFVPQLERQEVISENMILING